jgi:hypothetical protein
MKDSTLADDIARAERDVIDAACELVMGSDGDPWGYDYDRNLDALDGAVRHLTALRKLATTMQGDEQ